MKRHTVTIKDIAQKLGISPSTVSRALKDHVEISQETKNSVKRVAEELNYQPNSLALSLRYSKSNTIGVIIPEIVHFFFSTVISGIEDEAHSRGYNVIITQSNESLDREINNIQTLFNNRVDGVLMSISKETDVYEHLEALQQRGLPIVFFDRNAEEMKCSHVTVDDFLGGYQATEHLIKEGYTKIAHLAGPHGLQISKDRISGYRKALEDNRMKFDQALVIEDSASNEQTAYEATLRLFKQHQPDAIFAANDIAAMAAIKAVKTLGISVPKEFGVVGFSNWQFSSLTQPSISTIEQPGYEMGQVAADLLIKELESDAAEMLPVEHIILPTRLIVRDSSQKGKN
jgi:LacI family transcriptional regulator